MGDVTKSATRLESNPGRDDFARAGITYRLAPWVPSRDFSFYSAQDLPAERAWAQGQRVQAPTSARSELRSRRRRAPQLRSLCN
jgi:hypothetical protein